MQELRDTLPRCYEAVKDDVQLRALVTLNDVMLRWFAHEPTSAMVRADDTWLLTYYIEEIDRALLFELQCARAPTASHLLYKLKDDNGLVHSGLNLFALVDDAFFACLQERPGMHCDTCSQMIFNARSLVTLEAMLRHRDALCDSHVEAECKPTVLAWTHEVLGKKFRVADSWIDEQRWTELAGDTVTTRLSLETALAQCILPVGSTTKKMCLHTCDCKYQPKDAANARKHAQFAVPTQIKLAHLEAVRAGTVVCNACDVYFTCQLFEGKTQHQAMEREIQRFKDTLGRRKDKRKATGDAEDVAEEAAVDDTSSPKDALKRSRNDDEVPDFSEEVLAQLRAKVIAAAEAEVVATKLPVAAKSSVVAKPPVTATPRAATRTASTPSRHIIVNSFNMFKKLTEKFEKSIIYVNSNNVLCNAKGQLVDADDNYSDQPIYFDVDENLLPDFENDDVTTDGCYHILRYCVDDYGQRVVAPMRFKSSSDSESGGDSDSDGGNDSGGNGNSNGNGNGNGNSTIGQNGSAHTNKENSSTTAPNNDTPSMSEQLFMLPDDTETAPVTLTRSVSLSNINSWASFFTTRIDSTIDEASSALTTSRLDADANDPLWISMRYKQLERSERDYRREFLLIREDLLRLFENIRQRCTEASARMASQEEEHVALRRDNARFNVDIHEAIKLRDDALTRANVLLHENETLFKKANEMEHKYLGATSQVTDDTWKERATQLRDKLANATSDVTRLTHQLATLEERLVASELAQQNGAVNLHVAQVEMAEMAERDTMRFVEMQQQIDAANAIVVTQRSELETLRAQSLMGVTMDVSRRIADGASAICSQIASDIQEHDAAQPHVAAPRHGNTLFLDFAGRVFDSILQQAVEEIRMSMQLLGTLAEQFKAMCVVDAASPVLRQAEAALRAKLELMHGKIQTFETLNGAFKRSIEAPREALASEHSMAIEVSSM